MTSENQSESGSVSSSESLIAPTPLDITTSVMGGYSAGFGKLTEEVVGEFPSFKLIGVEVQYGFPAILTDLPGGLGAVVGLAPAAVALSQGNYAEAGKGAFGATGALAGGEVGAFYGALFFGPPGAFFGAIGGALAGTMLGNAAWNSLPSGATFFDALASATTAFLATNPSNPEMASASSFFNNLCTSW